MKRLLKKGLLTYEIECGFHLETLNSGLKFRDVEEAHAFLTPFMGDYYNMNTLRTLLGEATSAPLFRMNDHEVVREAAKLISGKRISVSAPSRVEAASGLTIVPEYVEAVKVSRPKPPEPPKPEYQPPEPPPPIPKLGAQVAAFKQAAVEGTPFCEACAEL